MENQEFQVSEHEEIEEHQEEVNFLIEDVEEQIMACSLCVHKERPHPTDSRTKIVCGLLKEANRICSIKGYPPVDEDGFYCSVFKPMDE